VRDPSNQLPVAEDDTVTTQVNTSIVIDVLANDSDPDGDPLAVASVDSPANGIATTDGAVVVYTPNGGFVGTDTFTYTASDDVSGISTATVTVTVQEAGNIGRIILSPMEITLVEGGDPVSYTVALGSQPSAVVTITLVIEGVLTADPTELIFNVENWNQPQTVTVSVNVDAAEVAGSAEIAKIRQNTIHHLSRSADGNYNQLGLPSVTVYVKDPYRGVMLPLITR
jgi:hypothetical protein